MAVCLHFGRIMALLLRKSKFLERKRLIEVKKAARLLSTEYRIPKVEDEYVSTPQYPRIVDNRPKVVERVKENTWYEKIRKQSTIEEKIFLMNIPRYWGWNCVMFKEAEIPYNSLNFIQYVTRTHLLNSTELPESLKENKTLAEKLATQLKGVVEDELSFQLSVSSSTIEGLSKEKEQIDVVVDCLNRVLLREVSNNASHLLESEIDYNPRLEAFWCVGGIDPPDSVVKRRKREKILDEENYNDPIDRWVQYIGSPALQIRHEKPLGPIWGDEVTGDVPTWKLEPAVLGFQNEYRHCTSIPGFWPGDVRDFGVMSYHYSNHIRHRPPSYGAEDSREALQAQAIFAAFGWLVPLAAYHGFSPFCQITYPMVTQTVLTDGKDFTFSFYQMNTNLVFSEFATDNPKVNLCWCSPTQALYGAFEDGKIKDLNEDVLSMLILNYLTEPKLPRDVNLRPYLGKEVQRIADIEEDEKRCWLEKEYKHFSSNRPRHRVDLQYELYEWERIYKVEHQTRPMDPRRRPFELDQHPYRRKMSDHPGQYIPRAIRPDKDLKKKVQAKFRKTYYPS